MHAKPRDPWPPLPEIAPILYHQSFDAPYWQRATNAELTVANFGTLRESWSGYALERSGAVAPFILPAMDSVGQTNFTTDAGAVRFWIKPYWSSAAGSGGTGPGMTACLVELAAVSQNQAAVVWSLQITPDGSALALLGQSDAGMVELFEACISWPAGEWHQVCLDYGTKQTTLYVDGELVAEGDGVVTVPLRVAELAVGSSHGGAASVEGEIEEVFTFTRCPDIAFGYHALKEQVARGPITPEEEQARRDLFAKQKAEREAESGGGGEMRLIVGETSECITNAPLLITNVVSVFYTNQGWTVRFDVQGTNGPADIFTATNLLGNNVTNSQWQWLEQGPTCSTYEYTNQPGALAFYILGTPLHSDNDGLTDAFERLVSKTDPNLSDTDGDGVSDFIEYIQGRNPRIAGSVVDTNGVTNLKVYTPLR